MRIPGIVAVAAILHVALHGALAAVTLSESQRSWLDHKSVLVFAADTDYPPYTFKGGDDQPRGLDVDVARAVGRVLRVPVEFRMVSWEEATRLVLRGEADALAGMTFTTNRAAQWLFADSHASVEYRLFVREDMQIIHDVADLAGMRVGVGKGSLVEPLLHTNPKITVVNYPRGEAMQELLNREISAFAGNVLVQSHFVQSHGIRGVKVVGEPLLPPFEYGIAVPKGQDQLLAIINAALGDLRARGELASIREKWIGEMLRPPMISREALRWLWIGLASAAGVALLGVFRSWELRHLVRRKTARIAAMRSLGAELSQTHDVEALVERAINELRPLLRHEPLFALVLTDGGEKPLVRQLDLPDALTAELQNYKIDSSVVGSMVETVLSTGQPSFRDASAKLLKSSPDEFGFRSVVCLPIMEGGRTCGVLGMLSRQSVRVLRKESDFYEAVAAELGIALDNAELVATLERRVRERTEQLNARTQILEADLQMARDVQLAMLPFQHITAAEIARSNGGDGMTLRLHHRYNPARTVGGDFFDVLRASPSGAGVFICDVMGQGARAALLTAVLRTVLGELADVAHVPHQFLTRLNRRFMEIVKAQDMPIFASAFYGYFELTDRTLHYANAGHPWPFLLHKSDRGIQTIGKAQRPGPALGLFADAEFAPFALPLRPDQSWLMFTDGLYEPCNPGGESFGIERVQARIAAHRSESTPQLLDSLLQDLRQFCGTDDVEDDVCLVAIETSNGS